MKLAFLFVVVGVPAWATCGTDEQTYLSCKIENSRKVLSICLNDDAATYRFGIDRRPAELSITEPMATFRYVPWNGLGRSIWEVVEFYNGAYTYEIEAGFDRMFDDQAELDFPLFGSVRVTRDEQTVVTLECDRTTVDYNWDTLIWEAKRRLGLEWDDQAIDWVAKSD